MNDYQYNPKQPVHSTARNRKAFSTEDKKVLTATLVGTSIEWYDYFIYAQVAGLVLSNLFFSPLVNAEPAFAQIISFASIGISFLFRPLGGIICGYLGDRYGRKVMLAMTLVLMGASTTLIGLLPTYAQIGFWGPLLLIFFRIMQGFSAGGEWGGAALMAVEHAPAHRRSFFGCFPQIGAPLGLIVATLMFSSISALLSHEQFMSWGWRLPFLFSIVLIIIGTLIRRRLEESPVFTHMQVRQTQSRAPLRQLFQHHRIQVIQTALIFMANNAAGYLIIAFIVPYGRKYLSLPASTLMLICTMASISWLLFTILGGYLGDRLGRIRTFQIGYLVLIVWAIPMWQLIDTGNVVELFFALMILSLALGLTGGPQATLYAEMFPPQVRYSGVSIGYAIGSILGGAFAATVAQWIIATYQTSWLIGLYILLLSVISLIACSSVRIQTSEELGMSDK